MYYVTLFGMFEKFIVIHIILIKCIIWKTVHKYSSSKWKRFLWLLKLWHFKINYKHIKSAYCKPIYLYDYEKFTWLSMLLPVLWEKHFNSTTSTNSFMMPICSFWSVKPPSNVCILATLCFHFYRTVLPSCRYPQQTQNALCNRGHCLWLAWWSCMF